MTISYAWKIWEEPNSAPTTPDKFHYKICFSTIGHTLKNCHVHFKKLYLSSHEQIQKGRPPKLKISIYTIDFSLEVDLNGIFKYLSIYFIFSEYTCQIGKEIVDYKFFNSEMLIK